MKIVSFGKLFAIKNLGKKWLKCRVFAIFGHVQHGVHVKNSIIQEIEKKNRENTVVSQYLVMFNFDFPEKN